MGIKRVVKRHGRSGIIKEKVRKRKLVEMHNAMKAEIEADKRAAKKSKKRKVGKKPKSNSLYGDWLDSPAKAAKKSRKKYIGVDEGDV